MSYEIYIFPMRTGSNEFENIQLGTSLEHKCPILMKCIRLYCKPHTMSSRWMGSFVLSLSNFCLGCIPQYEWGDEIQPMRSHQAPTPTNEVPPPQWRGNQYCHRDATWRVRGPPRSTCCERPGTKRISPGKKLSPQWKPTLRVSCPSIAYDWVSTDYDRVWEASLLRNASLGFFLSRGYQTYWRVYPDIIISNQTWQGIRGCEPLPCGAHLCYFSRMTWHPGLPPWRHLTRSVGHQVQEPGISEHDRLNTGYK